MEKTEVKTETKTNRYTILDAEVKRISKELKAKKQEMLKAIKDAEAAYREYRKTVYAPARKAAFDVFKAAKTVGTKPKVEKPAKKTAKKVVMKADTGAKVPGTNKTAAECIEAGEKAIAKFKAAGAKNSKAK